MARGGAGVVDYSRKGKERSARAKKTAAAYGSWRVQCEHVVIRLPPHRTSDTASLRVVRRFHQPPSVCVSSQFVSQIHLRLQPPEPDPRGRQFIKHLF